MSRISTLLAPDHKDRPPAPAHILDWQSFRSWRQDIWGLLDDVVDRRVRRAFLRSPPDYVVGDDLSWLDQLIQSVRRLNVDTKALVAERIVAKYTALRAVHGTQASDLNSFYQSGLRPLDPHSFQEKAKAIFLSGEFPELTAADLEKAFIEVGREVREGRVWFEANEVLLIDHCGHYMLYGSEYLTAIAAHLGGRQDYRQVLKRAGKPTLFVCDVSLGFISGHTLKEFAGTAVEMVFQELLDGDGFTPDRGRGAGFCIRKTLPPSSIVGHYHPVVRDPLLR